MKNLLPCLLLTVLAGCAVSPVVRTKIIKVPVTKYVSLPASSLTPCKIYDIPIKTNGQLMDAYGVDLKSLVECNNKILTIKNLEGKK